MSLIATNLVPNPSLETNSTGWQIPANWFRLADGVFGDRSYVCQYLLASTVATSASCSVGVSGTGTGTGAMPVSASTAYAARCDVKVVTQSIALSSVRLRVIEYDSGGTVIGSSTILQQQNTPTTGTTYALTGTFTTTGTTAYVAINLAWFCASTGASLDIRWDKLLFVVGSTQPARGYFDGNSTNCSWSGTADGSTSTLNSADAASALTSSGTISPTGQATARAAAAPTASGTLAAVGQAQGLAGAAMSGSAIQTSVGQVQGLAGGTLSGNGALSGVGNATFTGAATPSGALSFTSSATGVFTGNSGITGMAVTVAAATRITLTPYDRMVIRQGVGVEIPHPELGNGLLFTPTTSNFSGSFAYGPLKRQYLLAEAVTDGGVLTQDWDLAAPLRATGLFTETQT